MTFSYVLNTDIGKIRLLIQDKVNTPDDPAQFSDEEIQTFLTAEGSVYLGAALALESWAASLTDSIDSEHMGDYSYTKKDVANKLALAARLRTNAATAATAPAFGWGNYDLIAAAEDDEGEFDI